ncbi:P-loop containing nucleoside triphosphate hydrolase [Fagus crenata]
MVKKDAGEDCGSPRNSHGQAVGDGLVLAMHFGLADVDSGCGSSISLLVVEGSHWRWCGLVHDHHDGHHSHDHSHDPGVSSVSIVCEGNLDLEKANIWLGTLLLERSEDIYRMKGLLSVQGMNERFVFQGVHDIFQGSPDRLWGRDEQRMNKIVFIGKNLDAQELEKGFKACLL